MFDLTTDHRPTHDAHASPPAAIGKRDVRSQALRLVATSAGRMVLAARRIDGDDGAALAYALRDMILDRETDPIGWPLAEMAALLERGDPARDRQAARILRELRRIAERITDEEAEIQDAA